MIIKTDVSEITLSRPAVISTKKIKNPAPQSEITQNTINRSQSINSFINQERTLGDALSIAQTSQNILQKAMEVSARLKNIATQVINTGNVNGEEINRALSTINTSISQYGKQVSSPAQVFNNIKIDFPQQKNIEENITNVKRIATNMLKNNIDRQFMTNNEKQISNNLDTVNNSINSITSSLTALYGQYTTPAMNTDESIKSLSVDMKNHASGYIAIQGNINPETTQRLLR